MDAEKERMYQLHSEICKAMANPHRLALVDALRDGEKAVGDLAEELDLTVSNTSQHLSVLKSAGIVKR
ncbi:MAG: metalloregulator ArsR/SmtB family transcription factor, partial [bacterium]